MKYVGTWEKLIGHSTRKSYIFRNKRTLKTMLRQLINVNCRIGTLGFWKITDTDNNMLENGYANGGHCTPEKIVEIL